MRQLRRLYWPIMRRVFVRVISEKAPILSYPLIVYLSLDETARNIYIEKGRNALLDDIIKRAEGLVAILMQPKRNGIQESIEFMRGLRRQEEKEEKEEKEEEDAFIDNFYKEEGKL